VPLNHRQAAALEEAAAALCVPETAPLVILAEGLRHARSALDMVTGRIGVEDVLDALFGRFCLGK
jgi:tRNA modification GTPase